MTESLLVAGMKDRVKSLATDAGLLGTLPAAQEVSLYLDRAVQVLDASGPLTRPLMASFLGGTGVGKSSLFNSLVGKPDASPVSDAERCYTRSPYIAAVRLDRAHLQVPATLQPTFVDTDVSGVALCDTPDVDGMLEQNRDVARELVERSDLVVFVTSPDKRANFDIKQEVREWAARKRWLFVLNKMDQHRHEEAKIRADFDRRIHDLGFTPGDDCRFLVSAAAPEALDFPRLRSILFQPRGVEQLMVLRQDAFLAHVQHAVDPSRLAPLGRVVAELGQIEAQLLARIHASYCDALRASDAADAFRLVVREATWRQLGPRCGWFMWLPVWLRCRFSLLWAGYQLSRMTMRGTGLFGLLFMAGTSVITALRGLGPLRHVLSVLGPEYRRTLDAVRVDARRALEDRRLSALSNEDLDTLTGGPKEEKAASESLAESIPVVGKALDSLIRKLHGDDTEVLAQLGADVERIGQRTATKAVRGLGGRLLLLIANLIPAAMLGWIVYRIGEAWFDKIDLSLSFYAVAIPLFLVSFLPGLILLSLMVRSRVSSLDPPALVRQVDQHEALVPLRRARHAVERFSDEAHRLHASATEGRETLQRETGLDAFGVTVEPNSPERLTPATRNGQGSLSSGR